MNPIYVFLGDQNANELDGNLGFAVSSFLNSNLKTNYDFYQIKYLRKYGYLDENQKSYNPEVIIQAIEKLQSFARIPITGIIDEATIKASLN